MPLSNFPVIIRLPVLWGDQDLYGHVNNVAYLRWFESARVVYWDESGMRSIMTPNEYGPILASVHCNFRRQLRYPDTVHIGARIERLGRTSLTMRHAVYSAAAATEVADGESVVVLFNYPQQRGEPISTELRGVLEQFEGRTWEASTNS